MEDVRKRPISTTYEVDPWERLKPRTSTPTQRSQHVFVVDSFTGVAFGGNPAAVCVYNKSNKFTDTEMLLIAREMSLSETCFCFPHPSHHDDFVLRWFTPTVEVPLCGHGTLATAHVLFHELVEGGEKTILRFHTQRGVLVVHRGAHGMAMDFPVGKPGVWRGGAHRLLFWKLNAFCSNSSRPESY
jgi:predicted PhzF superfamily epimerase YddE/YHI9